MFRLSSWWQSGQRVSGHYNASKVRKRFKAAIAAAGLRSARFHDLRHTFDTRMAAAGAPLRHIQEWMGHRDYKATSIYADYAADPSAGRSWADRAFASAPTPAPSEWRAPGVVFEAVGDPTHNRRP